MVSLLTQSLLILLSFLITRSTSQYVGSCGNNASLEYGKVIGRPLAIVNGQVVFPHDLKTANAYCDESRASVMYARNFTKKCLKELAQQINSQIAHAISRGVAKNCADRPHLAKMIGCFNQISGFIEQEYAIMQTRMQQGMLVVNRRLKILIVCCNYLRMHAHMLAEGAKFCSSDQVHFLNSFLEGFTSDAIELICSGITPDSEECTSLALPSVNLTTGMARHDVFLPTILLLLE